MVCLLSLSRVGKFAVSLVSTLYVVEIRLLFLHVGGTELSRSLKHQVLQIVGKTSCFCRVVTATGAHGDVGLDARLLVVHRQVNLQTIVESVDAGVHRIARHCLILVVFCLNAQSEEGTAGNDKH